MRTMFGAVLLAVAVAAAHAAAPDDDLFAAWLIDGARLGGASVEVWRDPTAGPQAYFWRLLDADRSILAEMRQPRIPAGYNLNFGECKVRGRLRQDVLAIVKHRKKREWSGDVRAVWIADPARKAFVPRSPRRVLCRDEGFGL